MEFIKFNAEPLLTENHRLNATLWQRIDKCQHPISRRLLQIMEAKQSNLCVAADFTTLKEVIQLADTIGPKIAVLKIHVDIFDDFDASKIQQLKAISQKHNFLIMEDRYELNCLFVFYHLNFIVCVVCFF